MQETYYAATYWPARQGSVQSCAVHSERLFQSLSRCDTSFSHWFRQGKTRAAALSQAFPTDVAGLVTLFDEQTREEGRRPTDGFSADVWNGQSDEDSSSLSFRLGGTSSRLPEFCLLSPPEQGPTAERLLRVPTLAQVLRAMVRAFEPEWGLATSHAHRDLVSDAATPGTFIGWLTYFSHRRGPLPAQPPCVHLEPVDALGTLLVLTPERFTATRPDHLALAQDVSSRLERAGLLSPLRP